MTELPPTHVKPDWFSRVISQRPLERTLLALLAIPCACLAVFCLAPLLLSGCPPGDVFIRFILQTKPTVILPLGTLAQEVDGAQGTNGGWSGGLYSIDQSPEQVLDFYRRNGAHCVMSDQAVYELGGFRLALPAPYWQCDAPAKPWSRGAVDIVPQAGYVNALKAIYNDSPKLVGGIAISDTVVAQQLRGFYGQPPFPASDWPAGGTVLRTWVGWCDP
jgi:hypothetical protein